MRVPLSWLKEFVDVRVKPDELSHILTMGGLEVESMESFGNDIVLELGITPNRGDCLSILGIAREVAALTKRRLNTIKPKKLIQKNRIQDFLQVTVKTPKACPRYGARVIDDVKIGPSPSWLVERLNACNIRSINNVVDVTNYVMLEMGQPLHAFDYRKINGKKIIVKNPSDAATFTTLDDIKRDILPQDLMICDGWEVIALAGIMGGKNSEVSEKTTTVVIESAFFEPVGVRRTAKRLGLSSESSKRFERGVDPANTVNALNRAVELICEVAGGVPTTNWFDIKSHLISHSKIRLELADIKRILGVTLSTRELGSILNRLNFDVLSSDPRFITLKIPTYRSDIKRQIDVIEDIARLYGYENFESTNPRVYSLPVETPRFSEKEKIVRDALIGLGYSEAITMSFSNNEELNGFSEINGSSIEVLNPLSTNDNLMRACLMPGLLNALKVNSSRQRSDIKLFTIGKVFRSTPENEIEEGKNLAGVALGKRFPKSWGQSSEYIDFYDVKGAIEALVQSLNLDSTVVWLREDKFSFLHPGRSARILLSNKIVGFVGQLHPSRAKMWDIDDDCYVFEIDFDQMAKLSLSHGKQFCELTKYPFVERDMAIIIDDSTPYVEVLRVIQDSSDSLVTNVQIFDVYKGKNIDVNKKSMAYTIRYMSNKRTLTDEEVTSAHNKIVKCLGEKLGAVLRT